MENLERKLKSLRQDIDEATQYAETLNKQLKEKKQKEEATHTLRYPNEDEAITTLINRIGEITYLERENWRNYDSCALIVTELVHKLNKPRSQLEAEIEAEAKARGIRFKKPTEDG